MRVLTIITFVVAVMLIIAGVKQVRKQQRHTGAFALQVIGLAISMAGAAIQIMKIGRDRVQFNHNAVYHVCSTLGFSLFIFNCVQIAAGIQ